MDPSFIKHVLANKKNCKRSLNMLFFCVFITVKLVQDIVSTLFADFDNLTKIITGSSLLLNYHQSILDSFSLLTLRGRLSPAIPTRFF